jgi:DNA primase
VPGRIRDEDVEAARQRTDIVKVVSGYLELKKAGADRLVGLCPFHPEKTPSFGVSPAKQVYHCFGCGEGGNVFRFLEKIEGFTFVEVVEKLAAEAGVQLRYEGSAPGEKRTASRRQVMQKAIAEAGDLYAEMLKDGREAAEARAYLEARGITAQSVEHFGIGYAPGYPDFLLRRLSKTYPPELLEEAGLVMRDNSGGMRDRFRGRVVFPIHDRSDHAVGFGGRLLAGPNAPPNAPKYVNSAEGPIYHKGSLLYNLNRARTHIQRRERAVMVEGYTDVIALDQAGVPEAVATCGTALGEEHVKLLSLHTAHVLLCFDPDDAGAKAGERAFEFHERYPVTFDVVALPQGQDPADFVQAHGAQAGEAFAEAVERAVPLVEFMLDRTLLGRDLSKIEERAGAVKDGLALVAKLEDPVRRREYAGLLAAKVGVNVSDVLMELDRVTGPPSAGGPARSPRRIPPNQKVERDALRLLAQVPDLWADRLDQVDEASFVTPQYQKGFELIRDVHRSQPAPADPAAAAALLLTRAQDRGEQLRTLMAALVYEPTESGGEPTPDYVDRVFLRLREFALSRQIEETRKQLERLNPIRSQQEYDRMFEQLVALEGARRRVRVEAEAVGTTT